MCETDERERLLSRVAEAIREIEKSARIYLFGSRARGDSDAESDWDFLVIVRGDVSVARKEAIWHRLYDIELEEGQVLSARVVSSEQWDSPQYREMPLFVSVREEGIAV